METILAFARHDLTDAQWAVLEPLLPRGMKPGRPPVHAKRRLIDGIRWRTRAGVPWRDVPPSNRSRHLEGPPHHAQRQGRAAGAK